MHCQSDMWCLSVAVAAATATTEFTLSLFLVSQKNTYNKQDASLICKSAF